MTRAAHQCRPSNGSWLAGVGSFGGIRNRSAHSLPVAWAILGVLVSAVAVAGADSQPDESDHVTAVIMRDMRPSSFLNPNTGQPDGLGVDLLNAVAKQAGLEVTYIYAGDWKEVEETLRSGEADLCPVLAISDKRKEYLNYTEITETYAVTINVRAAHKDIRTLEDLPGHNVGLIRASQAWEMLKGRQDIHLIEYDSFQVAIFELLAGHLDAFIAPSCIVLALVQEAGIEDQVAAVSPPLAEFKRAIGVRKDRQDLFERLAKPVSDFTHSPEYQTLYVKWYGQPKPFWSVARVAMVMGTVLLLTIAGLMCWKYVATVRLNLQLVQTIAERERAEAELRESRELLRETERIGAVGGWEFDTDTREQTWTEEVYRIHEVDFDFKPTVDKGIGFYPPESKPIIEGAVQRAIEFGEPFDVELPFITARGNRRWVHAIGKADPEHRRVYGFFQDITDRRLMEAALRESEDAVRGLLDSATDSMFLLDAELSIITCNEVAAGRLNRTAREIIGREVLELYPPDVAQRRKIRLDQVLASRQPLRFEDDLFGRHYGYHLLPVMRETGEIYRIAMFARDITEQKQAEEELEREKQFVEAVLAALPGHVYVFDENGRFVRWNDQWEKELGYSDDDMHSMVALDAVSPRDRQRVAQVIQEVFLNGSGSTELYTLTKNGRELPTFNTGVRMVAEGKTYLVGIAIDITKRKQAEAALREHRETIDAIVETSAEWIWAIDREGVHTYSNPAVERILGYRPDEVVGKAARDLLHADDRKTVESLVPECMGKRCGWSNLLLRWRHKNGSYRYLESNAVPVLGSQGEIKGFRGVDRDITERKRAEDALGESQRQILDIAANLPGVIYQFVASADGSMGLSYVSERSRELFGIDNRVEGYFERFAACVADDDRSRFLESIQQAVAAAQHWDFEGQFVKPSGEHRWINVRSISQRKEKDLVYNGVCLDITDRKRAEATLRQSVSLLQATLESTADGILVVDQVGAITGHNKRFAQLWDIPQDVLDSHDDRRALECVAAQLKDPEGFIAKVHQLYATPEAESFDTIEFTDGRIFERYSQPHRIDGRAVGRVWSFRDVTGRKRSEETLRESEENYRLLFNAIHDVVFVHELTAEGMPGTFIQVNEAACRQYGYYGEEWQGMTVLDLDEPEGLAVMPEAVRKLTTQGYAVWEGMHHDRNGRRIPVEISAVHYRRHGIPMILSIVRDITERKKAEDALRASELRFRTLVEQAGDGFELVDEEGRFLDMNHATCRQLGYSREELLGMHVWDIDALNSRESFSTTFGSLIGKPPVTFETVHKRKDGVTFPVEVTASAIRLGSVLRGVSLARDISERKRAEQERAQLQEQLHQAQKMEAVGQLAGGVAHDFNNLLTVIQANIEAVEHALPANRTVQEAAGMVRNAAEQAVGVTRSLLALGRQLPTEKKAIQLQEVIRNVTCMLRRLLPASVELVVDIAPDPPLWIYADGVQLQQLLLNLAINGRDAMPAGGTLRISVCTTTSDEAGLGTESSSHQDFACLVVSDTGSGITEEVRLHMFEPFFSTKPRGEGTGLGLSIVHGIVENHDGQIDVQTEIGKGSTFKVCFPRIEPTPGESEPAIRTITRGRGETILLAEDNQFVRSTIVSVLQGLGYEVIPAPDGPSLISSWRAQRERARLLILDVDLPGQSGIDCLHAIRGEGGSVPVIMITGAADHRIEDEADERTFPLHKPFGVSQLGILAGRLLGMNDPEEAEHE